MDNILKSQPERADYGKQTIRELSKVLTRELGRGFSVSNLQFMRRFYLNYQIQQTVSVKLSWSHYCELLSISDPDKRSFYEKEAINANWSVRELKRQIDCSLFERLLLSRGDANKNQALSIIPKKELKRYLPQMGQIEGARCYYHPITTEEKEAIPWRRAGDRSGISCGAT